MRKKKKEGLKDFVGLYRAWEELYEEWLKLSINLKELFPMPRKPIYFKGKIYL